MTAQLLALLLGGYKLAVNTEAEMQAKMAEILTRNSVLFIREYQLDDRNRLDFFLPALRTALELKTKGGALQIARQLKRYASNEVIDNIILATTRPVNMPAALSGKPVLMVELWRNLL